MTFRTTEPAIIKDPNTGRELRLTFDAQGTTSSSNSQSGSITSGTFQIASFILPMLPLSPPYVRPLTGF